MTAQQRNAWYNLLVFAVAVAAYLVLVPLIGFSRAWGAFGLCGLWGFGVLFYKRKRGRLVQDERDEQIGRRSLLFAYSVFWLYFVGACMIPWGLLFFRGEESISVHVLPHLVFGGMIVVVLAQSVAILIQYGRTKNRAEE